MISLKSEKFHNRKYHRANRKALRNSLTAPEAFLWKFLKGRRLEGRKFRRQHSLGNYIVDFYCPSEKLIIELDGDFHNEESHFLKDRQRDDYLSSLGYTILRFENKFVFEHTHSLLREISSYFQTEN